MKKKFLSLMMAAAVVATTSVSAFAADNIESVSNGKINGADNKEYKTDITITGDVEDTQGNGTLSVTVPTAASFRVKNDNTLQGTKINVKNEGTQGIDVFAYQFIDTTKSSKITVLGKDDLESAKRTSVSLGIGGNLTTAYLGSDPGNSKGIYKDENLNEESTDSIKIASVPKQSEYELTLSGEAGKLKDEIGEPVSDNFTLVLKIAKTK